MTSSWWRGVSGVLLDIFSRYFLVVCWPARAAGRNIIIAGVLGPGGPGPPVPVCFYAAHCEPQCWGELRPDNSGHETHRDSVNCQAAEDRMSGKISIYIFFTITSLAGDSFIMEIIYRKSRGGKNSLLYSPALESILFWEHILYFFRNRNTNEKLKCSKYTVKIYC